jgi:DNA invertase Pin-like site-specific DNA recombinase
MVGLSDVNAEKWRLLLKQAAGTAKGAEDPQIQPTAGDYETVTSLRQRHTWLSDDDIAKLVAGYKSGLSVYQLAEQFGCHRTTVSRGLKDHGTKMRGRPLTEEQIGEAQSLYTAGLTLTDIGKQVGANRTTVRGRLENRGLMGG